MYSTIAWTGFVVVYQTLAMCSYKISSWKFDRLSIVLGMDLISTQWWLVISLLWWPALVSFGHYSVYFDHVFNTQGEIILAVLIW